MWPLARPRGQPPATPPRGPPPGRPPVTPSLELPAVPGRPNHAPPVAAAATVTPAPSTQGRQTRSQTGHLPSKKVVFDPSADVRKKK